MNNNGNLSTMIYEELKKDIIEMRLPPNTFILERQIAAKFSTSRTPVREAIKRLRQEGWLVGEVRCRNSVSDLNLTACREVFAVRAMIEKHALFETTAKGEGRPLAGKLDVKLNEMKSLKDDPIAMVRADLEFHYIMVEQVGNALLTKIWSSISDEVIRISIFAMDEQRKPERIIEEHEKLVEALWDHSPDLPAYFDNHMNEILSGLARCFEKRQPSKQEG